MKTTSNIISDAIKNGDQEISTMFMEMSIKMAISDIVDKGKTDETEILMFTKTKYFQKMVSRYYILFEKQFTK